MKLSDLEKKYVFTTKVFIDEDKKDYIVCREPTFTEYQQFTENDDKKNAEIMKNLLPNIIIGSSITDEEGNPASSKDISELIEKSGLGTMAIIGNYLNAIPFQSAQRKSKK